MAKPTGTIRSAKGMYLQISLPAIATVALFILTIFYVVLPAFKEQLIERKKQALRLLTETVCNEFDRLARAEAAGQITREEAQARAMEFAREQRYGPERKDYFWVMDMSKRMLVHPYMPELEGQDVSHMDDGHGTWLFDDMVNLARAEGSGYVTYMWQRWGERGDVAQKVSHVRRLEAWGWIVGTGMYMDDVAREVVLMRRRVTWASAAILCAILLLSGYIMWQGIRAERRRAETADALWESDRRFRQLAENVREVFWLCDPSFSRVLFLNPAYEALWGRDREEVYRSPASWMKALHEEDRPRVLRAVSECMPEGEYEDEFRIRRPDGSVRWIHARAFPVRGADGEVQGVAGIADDVTERKEREQRSDAAYRHLKADEEQLRALYNQLKASEDDLIESQRAMSTLMSNLPGMAYRCLNDPAWTMEFVSEGAQELLGYAPFELRGNGRVTFGSLIHPEDFRYVWDAVQDGLGRNEPFRIEYRVCTADGKVKWVWEQGQGVLLQDGRFAAIEGFITDITASKEAEDALRRSEEHFRSLIESASDMIVVVDPSGIVRYASPSTNRILGHAERDLSGANVMEWIHRDDKPRVLQAIRAAVETPRASLSVEFRVRHADDHWVFFESIGRAVPDEAGQMRVIINARDVTDRKKAEEELSRLAMAVEQAAEIIIITDIHGTIQYVNPAFESVSGYSREEALGQTPRMLRSGEHSKAFYQKMWSALLQGKVWTGHFINRRKDGTIYEEDATINPMRDGDGRIVSFVAVKRDVTREVELDNRLRQAQKLEALGTLAGGIAHDFNNILSAIFGFAELTRMELEENHKARGHLDEVLGASKRARDLVRQILTFSRDVKTERVPVEMPLIVKEALKLIRASLPTTITISQDIDSGAGQVLADPTHLHQVIMNLCTNAYHAMEERGGILEVSLHSHRADAEFASLHPRFPAGTNFVSLSVRDTGCGMDRATIERIFDPFFTTKAKGKGTGLGLATVHGIITSLDGEIGVQSEQGRGSTFTVFLPSCLQAQLPPSTENIDERDIRGSERVLMVDDEEPIALMAKSGLERLGYRVTAKMSSRDALDIFRGDPRAYDIVITDQTMPELTGLELAAEMLRLRPDLPIIMCSGFSETQTQQRALDTGIRVYVTKPVICSELAALIRTTLDRSRAETV